MTRQTTALTALASALLAVPVAAQAEPGAELRAELHPAAVKRWTYALPAERWVAVGDSIPIRHAHGTGFVADQHPTALKMALDTDGDGRTDVTIRGSSGFAVLKIAAGDGEAVDYAVRFRARGTEYDYASSSVLQGSLGGTKVVLIDQDNDGDFGEFGVDAMVVGNAQAASYLSPVTNIDGVLYAIRLQGTELTAAPWSGPTGTLSIARGFESNGRLDAAVVTNEQGHSFELSRERDGLRVPAGTYRISGGVVSRGNETVQIASGRMQGIVVGEGEDRELRWGGPLVAEFEVLRSGEKVTIEPASLHFYGRAGEEYREFLPQGSSPKFLIFDDNKKRLLATGRFEGC
ncbi:MAG: hypothetical protein IPM29_29255 [Planctomycetes bacterium]|nr:hypothetical protein [Planctomycetota bacterium]